MIRYLPDDPRSAVRLIDAEAERLEVAVGEQLLEVDVDWADGLMRGEPKAVLRHLAELYVRASNVVIEHQHNTDEVAT